MSKAKITNSDLLIEKLGFGGVVDPKAIRSNLEQSIQLLDELENHTIGTQHLLGSENNNFLKEKLVSTRVHLDRFRDISELRIISLNDRGTGSINSSIQTQYDAEYRAVFSQLQVFDDFYQRALDRGEIQSRKLLGSLGCNLDDFFVGMVVIGLWRKERRQQEAENALLESEACLIQSQKMDAVAD